ncbi:hypothetical protein [Massilia glaciei]|uniref:hypothetical protein n=1 Tax=Massilia glaciei TaxID=1524097 RepID=UPI0011B1F84B|nr:hypothetical protein [Massilia glaciei]
MSSKSWPEDLQNYAATRLLRPRIALLWLVVGACMLAASAGGGPDRMAASMLLAAFLIAQFRLWDDLADRAHDARHHARRVLVGSPHAGRFSQLCVAGALPVLGLLWAWREPMRLAAYGLLCAAMAGLYLASGAWPRLLRAQLVLLKYPSFVWLVASGVSPRAGLGLGAALWLVLALHDLLSDRTLQAGPHWRALAAIECLALIALLGLAALGFFKPVH